jgi:tetratricopeptide (TPR) repeat protein
LSPDTAGYRKLADIAKVQGQMDEWKAALDESLKQEVQDLNHARVRVDIARYLMSKKEFKEALPYAEKAAETWAEWAMMCARDCHEGAGDWDKAELWARRITERYPPQWYGWLFWCCRVGKGDRKAAQDFAEQYIQNFDTDNRTGDDWYTFALVYTAMGRTDKALEAMEHAREAKPGPWISMLMALECDELGKTERRDKLFQEIGGTSAVARLGKLFAAALANGGKDGLDLQAVDKLLDQAGNGKETCAYAVGRFLDNRGKTKEANAYFNRCALGDSKSTLIKLSVFRLRNEGLEPKLPEMKGGK